MINRVGGTFLRVDNETARSLEFCAIEKHMMINLKQRGKDKSCVGEVRYSSLLVKF